MSDTSSPRHNLLALGAVCAVLGGLAGGIGVLAVQRWTGDRMIHDYIVNHPEVLPEAMENLHRQEDTKALAGISSAPSR